MKKRIFALMMTLSMASVFTTCACYAKEETSTAYESLDEINEKIGVNLVTPKDMELTDESFNVIDDKIAEYKFTADGIEYTFRGALTLDEDISNVYSDGKLLLDPEDEDGYAEDENGKIMAWTLIINNTESQEYELYAEDHGTLDEDTFRALQTELQDGTLGIVDEEDFAGQIYGAIEGTYTDQTSERATLDIENNGTHVTMLVHWGSSATEYTQWKMTATYDETYGLIYNDCVKTTVTYKDNGEVDKETVEYENGEGSFAIDGKGNLLWTGASEDSCQSCVFIKE